MNITIDTGSPYVWVAIVFFAIMAMIKIVLTAQSIALNRKLLAARKTPSLQLVTALDLVEQVVTTLGNAVPMIRDEECQSRTLDHIIQVRRMAARLKSDAGL